MRYLIVIFLFISFSTMAQKLDYSSADRITYLQFSNHQYQELKVTGNLALQQEIDFYYLRMRLGIAYYEEQNYDKALGHFERALAMNPMDTTAQEYLYFSYLFSGRVEDAADYAESLTYKFQQKFGYQRKSVDCVSLNGGTSFTSNMADNSGTTLRSGTQQYAEATYHDRINFAGIYMQNNLSSRMKFYWGASLFNTQAKTVVQTFKNSGQNDYTNNQYQYNVGLSYQFKKGWNLGLGAGLFQQNLTNYQGLPFPSPPATVISRFDFISKDTSENAFALNVGLSKRIRNVQAGIAYSFSNFSNYGHHQFDFSLLYFPFGNLNLYSLSTYSILQNTYSSTSVVSEKIGIKLHPKIYTEALISYGSHTNFVSQGTFLTYNTPDPIKLIAGMDLKFLINHLHLTLGYRYNQREGTRTVINTIDKPEQYSTTNFNYSIHLITTTLTWKF